MKTAVCLSVCLRMRVLCRLEKVHLNPPKAQEKSRRDHELEACHISISPLSQMLYVTKSCIGASLCVTCAEVPLLCKIRTHFKPWRSVKAAGSMTAWRVFRFCSGSSLDLFASPDRYKGTRRRPTCIDRLGRVHLLLLLGHAPTRTKSKR